MTTQKREVVARIRFAGSQSTSLPYVKGDHVQINVLNDEVALVFHQLDYQRFIEMQQESQTEGAEVPTHIVARIVMRGDAFARFVAAASDILKERPELRP